MGARQCHRDGYGPNRIRKSKRNTNQSASLWKNPKSRLSLTAKTSKRPSMKRKDNLPVEYRPPVSAPTTYEMAHPERGGMQSEGVELLLQDVETSQGIYQLVVVKHSENVEISLTNIQALINLQFALQLAIELILSVSLLTTAQNGRVIQDLTEVTHSSQRTVSTIVVENSRNVTVNETTADIAANVQLLLQVLLAIVAKLDVA